MPNKRVRHKICPFCKRSFPPNYRHGDNQKTCGRLECQQQRRNRATAQRRKTKPIDHRLHYLKYVKPERERQKALKAQALILSVGEPGATVLPSDIQVPPVVLTQYLCEQITTYVSQCFTRLQQCLSQAA
jgi:hypothetical protein